VNILGTSEYALRLFPLLAGIFSLYLFFGFARKFESTGLAVAGLVLFIFLFHHIYYSVEVKQYILDVTASLLIVLYIFPFENRNPGYGRYVKSGGLGALLIWFSNASLFILAGVGIWMFIDSLKSKKPSTFPGYITMAGLWLFSFGGYYLLFIKDHPYTGLQVEAFISSGYLPGHAGVL
jgi:uncharacterized membrane protein